jgi:hypothetical protein
MLVNAGLSSFQAVMATNNFTAMRPFSGFMIIEMPMSRQACTGCAPPDFYLRC